HERNENMFTKELAKRVLDAGLTTGADYAEIFFEDTYSGVITMISGKVESDSSKHLYGAGIRLLRGVEEVYGYTSDITESGLMKLTEELRSSFDGTPCGLSYELVEEDATKRGIVKIGRESKNIPSDEKIAYMRTVDNTITSLNDERIIQRIVNFTDRTQYVTIASTDGKFVHDIRNQERIALSVVAKNEKGQYEHTGTTGGNFDIDGFKNKDLVSFAKDVCEACLTMLDAPEMVGGVYPVIIHNGFGGVLFHEACGHSLEASSVARGMSVFCGKYGQKIASDVVTAIDDGTIYNEWGSLNVDDEGKPTQKNVLIKDGVLTSYMIDGKNTRLMNMKATGNSRRESYRFIPTSRMTNTYIANGKSTVEEIIAATEHGLFAKSMGGGSVNPITGEFNFAVTEGYMVENGKITHPVRGATLIGNGANALFNIDMVANNQTFGHGMCGSSSGSIHANVGEPTIRIQNMTVGGNGKK
ncbi:MAG: TldD/PmbA family protein, partial [Clostridiales bacterium]|nr:TldD/PmbA family protein [Clostridiales bacterium]